MGISQCNYRCTPWYETKATPRRHSNGSYVADRCTVDSCSKSIRLHWPLLRFLLLRTEARPQHATTPTGKTWKRHKPALSCRTNTARVPEDGAIAIYGEASGKIWVGVRFMCLPFISAALTIIPPRFFLSEVHGERRKRGKTLLWHGWNLLRYFVEGLEGKTAGNSRDLASPVPVDRTGRIYASEPTGFRRPAPPPPQTHLAYTFKHDSQRDCRDD